MKNRLNAGWIIVPLRTSGVVRALQVATGQWCPIDQATWFPYRQTAVNYARDSGYLDQVDVEIRYHAPQSSRELLEQMRDPGPPRRRLA